MSIDKQIDELKKMYVVTTDSDLAKRLRIDKRAVASWRSRGVLPKRYEHILTGLAGASSSTTPPNHWGEYDKAAARIAHFRISRAIAQFAGSTSVRANLSLYRKVGDNFFIILANSHFRITEIMEQAQIEIGAAEATFIFEDLSNSQKSIERDMALLGITNFLEGAPPESPTPA